MTLAGELATRIVSTRYEDLPAQALDYAKIGILDTLGVALAGSREEATRIAAKVVGLEPGASLIFGGNRRANPLTAAFVNAIAANVLDFDDCTDHLGGHPSAPILPALFALAEELNANGRDVILAYVAGFETETQIGKGVNFHHYEKGYTANADALEHHQGFLDVFNGPGTYSVKRMLEKWGTPFDIVLPGIAIKQHPCCLSVQSALDATLALVRAHDISADKVARIDSLTYARRLEHTNRPAPRSALEAKLSIQYCLARAVLDRQVVSGHFEGDAYRDAAVQRLMKVVYATPFPGPTPAENDDFGAEIRITSVDGDTFTHAINRPVGHEPGVPLPAELLKTKFELCAAVVLRRDQASRVYSMVMDFDKLGSINELTAALAASNPG